MQLIFCVGSNVSLSVVYDFAIKISLRCFYMFIYVIGKQQYCLNQYGYTVDVCL